MRSGNIGIGHTSSPFLDSKYSFIIP
jgi:hypothetical protein